MVQPLATAARWTFTLVLLALLGACAFGFLASFEPPGAPFLGAAYAVAGGTCIYGLVRVLRAPPA